MALESRTPGIEFSIFALLVCDVVVMEFSVNVFTFEFLPCFFALYSCNIAFFGNSKNDSEICMPKIF